jgi:8-oxo-dGTP diphosphatase
MRVAAGLIVHGDRLLVCQRKAGGPFPLKWEFPGGKLEESEGPLEGLRRELKEELDVEVLSAREIFRHSHRYPDAPAVELIFFHVGEYRGAPVNRVFQNIRWAALAELDKIDFLDGDLPLIEKLAREGLPK